MKTNTAGEGLNGLLGHPTIVKTSITSIQLTAASLQKNSICYISGGNVGL